MSLTPHEQIASAGFSVTETKMLTGVFDSVFSAHYENPAAADIIVDSLCMMAGFGTRAPAKLAAYAGHRARMLKDSQAR